MLSLTIIGYILSSLSFHNLKKPLYFHANYTIFSKEMNMAILTITNEENIIDLLTMLDTSDIDFEPTKLDIKLLNPWEPEPSTT